MTTTGVVIRKVSTSQHKFCAVRHCKGWAPQGDLATGHCKNTVVLGTAGIRCHGHCRNTAGLGTAGILYCWAVQEYSTLRLLWATRRLCHRALQKYCGFGHCRDALTWALQKYCGVGHCRDTLLLGTARILSGCCWSLQECSAVGHCRDTLRLGTGIFGGWAEQGYSAVGHCRIYFAVGHCRDILRLGTAGMLCGWALQGHSAVRHCRDTWWLGTTGLCDCALQGYSAVGHCRDTWWSGTAGMLCGWALQSGFGRRARTTRR